MGISYMNFLFPIYKQCNGFGPQVFRWKQSLKVLTSAFSHSHMNLWKCEMCATEFLLQTWETKARLEWPARVQGLFLYCELPLSANSLHKDNQVRYCWMLAVPGSKHKLFSGPQGNSVVVSGEFCFWTWILTNTGLWAAEKAVLFLLKVMDLTTGRQRRAG